LVDEVSGFSARIRESLVDGKIRACRAGPGAEVLVDKKKVTNKLGAEELEKRKAPFASPIVNREGDGRLGSGGTESVGSRRDPQPDVAPPEQGPVPKTPIINRTN